MDKNRRKIKAVVEPSITEPKDLIFRVSTVRAADDEEGDDVYTIENQIIDGKVKHVCVDDDPEKQARFKNFWERYVSSNDV